MPAALSPPTRDSLFTSTRWTVVYQAADSKTSSDHALSALSELCQIYWRPVYLFLRRQGIGPHDAQDLTQSFFAELIENRAYARADEMKGRFRSFLLGTLKHFLGHARDHDRAQKRGGGAPPVQLDEAALSEVETHAVRCQGWSADGVFEREWAASLLRQALERLAQEYAVAGRAALFDALKVHIGAGGAAAAIPYEEMAKRLGRVATTLRSDVARLRARYRAILREEVSGTLVDPRDIDGELRHLRQAMAA
jgi:RNA polymerase sigma factor (sigma-70 family)